MAFIGVYIIPFLVVLTVLVFIHELGHYLVARYNGVFVEVFSIGFGPELFGWTDRHQTRWKFCLIPLGGYVRMFGDADASSRPDLEVLDGATEEQRGRSLHSKTVWQRIAVSLAGPLANFLFALVGLTLLFSLKGFPEYPAQIGSLMPGYLAEKVGLQVGDEVVSIDASPVTDFQSLRKVILANPGKSLTFHIRRHAGDAVKELDLQILPEVDETSGRAKPIGIAPAIKFVSQTPVQAFANGATFIMTTCMDLLRIIGRLIIGDKEASQHLGGIISIGNAAGEHARGGVWPLLFMMISLSINLGMINLLPIPVLDGGSVFLCLVEAIRGKPVGEKALEYIFLVGFVIVMGLMVFSMWNDLVRFKVIGWLFGK